jgi:hypothetical protein
VLHAEHRQLQTDHPADLASPQPAGVDDVLRVDLTPVGHHVPGAVRPLPQVAHPGVAVDLGSRLAGADGIGVGDSARIDVTLDRVVERADEVLVLEQREHLLRLERRDDLELHAEVPAARLGHAQPVEALAVAGQHQPAWQVDRAALTRAGLDPLIELDGVLLQLGDVGVAVQGVHAPGRVPRRPGRELLALDQHHVGPAGLGEVVEHRRSDDTATDDDHLRRGLHGHGTSPLSSPSGRHPR